MRILINPKSVVTKKTWKQNTNGCVLVSNKNDAVIIFNELWKHDQYWENYRHLVQIAPAEIKKISDLNRYCDFCGKTEIDYDQLKTAMDKQGVDFILYQY